jgi:Membrane-fusion protein
LNRSLRLNCWSMYPNLISRKWLKVWL